MVFMVFNNFIYKVRKNICWLLRYSVLWLVVFFLMVPDVLYAIDCDKVSNFSEKEICLGGFLLDLDDAMNLNYKSMMLSDIGGGAIKDLRSSQQKWLSKRNKCSTKECILDAYKHRIIDICNYPVITGIHPVCKSYEDVFKKELN